MNPVPGRLGAGSRSIPHDQRRRAFRGGVLPVKSTIQRSRFCSTKNQPPSVHSLVRSKSDRDRSGCRPAPELGSARTEKTGQSPPPRATAHMDAIGNDWNTAPACVLSTVWGTASIRDLAVEVGAVPASPNRQSLTARRAGCAEPQSSARPSLWICGQGKSLAHKPTGPTADADNLNDLKISGDSARFPITGSLQGDHAELLRPLPPSIRGS